MPSKSLRRKAMDFARFVWPPPKVKTCTRVERRLEFLVERRATKKLVRQLNTAVKTGVTPVSE